MLCRNFVCAAALLAALGVLTGTASGTPLITSGLFVDLDGSNLGADTSAVSVWVDKSTDGSSGTVQDFGNSDPGTQPTVLSQLMPNGTIHKVVNLVRGSVSSTQSSTATSQFLQSNVGGSNAGFTAGGDAAYEVGGTAGADGLSYFVVYRSNITTVPTSGNNERQARQTVIQGDYSTAASNFGTFYHNSAGGTEESIPDIYHGVRDSAAGQQNHLYGDVTSPDPSWYISAVSWDLDAGQALSRVVSEDQLANSDFTIPGVAWATSLGTHAMSWLGRGSSSATGGTAFDGQISELLIYNTALSQADMDTVVDYLNQKYLVPEPSSFVLLGLAGTALIGWARRRRVTPSK